MACRFMIFAFLILASMVVPSVGCQKGTQPSDTGGAIFRFKPADTGVPGFGEVPYPSDLYLDTDGTLVNDLPGLNRLIATRIPELQEALGSLDGFGRTTAAFFFSDGPIDETSLPLRPADSMQDPSSLLLLDVDSNSPTLGARYPVQAHFLSGLSCLSVMPQPGAVLPPGVRHALIVTRGIRDTQGRRVQADTALLALLDKRLDQRKSTWETIYGDAIDQAISHLSWLKASDIAAIAVFTTSKKADELFSLHQIITTSTEFPQPALLLDPADTAPYSAKVFGLGTSPNLDDWLGSPQKDELGVDWPGVDNPSGVAHDAIAVIATGAYASPSFLDPQSRHFESNQDGSYRLAAAKVLVPVTLVIPKGTPPSSAGYPVVICGHGLGDDRSSMVEVANTFARNGYATIGIDAVDHGSRIGQADQKSNYPGSFLGPDGLPDEPILAYQFLGGFTDAWILRDNLRQTVLDYVSLVRLLQNPSLDLSPLQAAAGGTVPKLDSQRLVWNGGSLGGIIGSMVTAVEPKIQAAALHVPGGGFLHLMLINSPAVATMGDMIIRAQFGLVGDDVVDLYHPLPNLMAQVMEAGDPLVFAPTIFLRPPTERKVNVLVTYALDDEGMPNLSTYALIRALGIPLAEPFLGNPDLQTGTPPFAGNMGLGTGAAVQYAPATHGLGWNHWDKRNYYPGLPNNDPKDRFPLLPKTIRIEMPIREHGAQMVRFFQSALFGATAQIIMTKPPVADFDGDGVSDEQEIAAGTDPYDPASR